MATVSGTGSSTSTTNTAKSTAATDSKSIANNFDQFLLLLTTQLKNQNPLDPMDTNQFTSQLVQFASVEQLIKSNSTLGDLLTATKASNASAAANFVGMTVTADGASSPFDGTSATWNLNAPRAATGQVTVKNSAGEIVWSENRSLTAGDQTFTWDGRTIAGTKAPSGTYTIGVTAADVSGKGVTVSTMISGVVDAVDITDSGTVLKIGDISVPMDKVKSVRRSAA
jgi:flagellar basal-body rod modification protein FlgD